MSGEGGSPPPRVTLPRAPLPRPLPRVVAGTGHGDVPAEGEGPGSYDLRLYVAGQTPRSLAAISNLRRICEEHLAGRYLIEVIDLTRDPQLAEGDQILALPTLVRRLPTPLTKIIGDLSNTERVLVGLDIRPKAAP